LSILVIGVGAWLWLRTGGEEERIRERLHQGIAAATWSERENPIAAGLKVQKLADYVLTNVAIRVPSMPFSISSRRSLVQMAAQARTQADGLALNVEGVTIDIADDKASAIMEASVQAVVDRFGERTAEWMDLRFHWRKEDGEWRIERIEKVEAIRRIDGT
jgi:hypothetical protein